MIRDEGTKNFCIRSVTFKWFVPDKRLVEYQIRSPKMYKTYHRAA